MKQVMNYNKDNGLLNMKENRPHDQCNILYGKTFI